MPRSDEPVRPDPRPGPYESPYQVLRGYDAPVPGQDRTPDRGPVLVAGSRAARLA